MPTKIQLRRGTASQWSSANPVLAAGEVGVELDTKQFKIGDGTSLWNNLAYTAVGSTQLNSAVAASAATLSASIASEQSRAIAAEAALQAAITAIQSQSNSSIQNAVSGATATAAADLQSEAIARAAADAALSARIDNIVANVNPAALDSLSEIVTAFQAADSTLNGAISSLASSSSAAVAAEQARAQSAEASLSSLISAETTARQTALSNEVTARDAAVASEALARQNADTTISANLSAEISRAQIVEAALRADLDSEVANRIAAVSGESSARASAVSSLQASISTLQSQVGSNLQTALAQMQADIAAETSAREAADALLVPLTQKGAANGVATLGSDGKVPYSQLPVITPPVSSVNGLTGDVSLSTTNISEGSNLYYTSARAKSAAVVNSTSGSQTDQAPSVSSIKAYVDSAVNSEASTRQSQDSLLVGRLSVLEGTGAGSVSKAQSDAQAYADSKVAALVNSAPAVLDTLKELADALGGDANFATTVAGQIGSVQTSVNNEVSARQTAVSAVQANVDAEVSARQAAVSSLQSSLNSEISSRTSGDTALQTSITTEATTRAAADTALQNSLNSEISRAQSAESSISAAVVSEAVARSNADTALSGRLDVLEGVNTVTGSVAKALKDAKDYTDSSVSSEASTRASAVSALSTRVSALESPEVAVSSSASSGTLFTATGRSVIAHVSVLAGSKAEVFQLMCVYNGTKWFIGQSAAGEASGVTFSISAAGVVSFADGASQAKTMKYILTKTTV